MPREIQRNLALSTSTRGGSTASSGRARAARSPTGSSRTASRRPPISTASRSSGCGQAARRAQQLEAEAERQRQRAERADRRFWEETGAQRDEAGLRAYLERYPTGSSPGKPPSSAAIEEENRSRARGQDRAGPGMRRRRADTIVAYQRYLEAFPEGASSRRRGRAAPSSCALRTRSRELAGPARPRRHRAQHAHRAGDRAAAGSLGLDPGEVDGTFDRGHAAGAAQLPARPRPAGDGLPDEPTLVRLLADTLGQALAE
jgi:hypothetical protein